MRTERTPPARRYWAALLFLLLGTLAGVWHTRTTDKGKPDLIVGAVRGAVAPPANALNRFNRWFGDQTGWIGRGRALADENEKLRQRVAELESQTTALAEADIKLNKLKDDLEFVRTARTPPLAAEVIAHRADPKFDTLLLNRGARDGIHVHSVVVTRSGVVGQVSEITPTTATVLMLTDQNAGVGGRVQRPESRALGICKGDNTRFITLTNLPPDADIKPGDKVVTSGIGGIFPSGLLIGTVENVTRDSENVNNAAQVRPSVDFARLEEVYVLR
jgi:rod shape-determining protein MreC